MTATQHALESPNGQPTCTRRVQCYVPRSALLWLVGLTWIAGCTTAAPVSGLRPEYPEARQNVIPLCCPELSFVKLDSLQPTLRWEVFPRPQDLQAAKDGLPSRIRHVTYDLKIWRVDDHSSIEYPGELVYARQGLPQPSHKIEEPLDPSTEYSWTIRARFELDGHLRATKWGVSGTWSVPSSSYYRFETPSE